MPALHLPRRATFYTLLAALVAGYLLLYFGAVWRAWTLHCLSYFDFGLYSSAVARLGVSNPNPYLPAQGSGIFNDHFDPILWLALPLARWLGAGGGLLVMESLCVLSGVVPLLLWYRRGDMAASTVLVGTLLLLFNTGNADAVSYPVHPTTWAAGPMVWLIFALHHRRHVWAVLALLALFACKEEFPFVGIALAPLLWIRRERRVAVVVAILSCAWLGMTFVWRPAAWGPCTPHAAKLYTGLFTDPLTFVGQRLGGRMGSRLGSLLATAAPLIVWLRMTKLHPPYWLLAALLPLLAIRFLGMAWTLHYLGCLMAGVVATLLVAVGKAPLPRWVLVVSLVAVFWTTTARLKHAVRLLSGQWSVCPPDPARLASIEAGAAWLAAQSQVRALVGPNLTPRLAELPEVYPLAAIIPHPPYSAVFVERAPHGQTWPITAERTEQLVALWREQAGARVVIDDGNVFLAEGVFNDDR